MENQQKYQPLLEKILENLEADKGDREPGHYSAKYGLEVPTIQSEAAVSPRFVQHIPSNENIGVPHNPIGMTEETEIAGQDFEQFSPEPASVSFTSAFSEPLSDQLPETYYEETHIEEAAPSENAAPHHYLQTMEPQDQIPALFHRDELDTGAAHKIPITKALYGLTGAIVIGAASVFYLLPEQLSNGQDTNKLAVIHSSVRLFPEDNTTNFAADNRYSLSGGVSGDSWEKGPKGNLLDNTGKDALAARANVQPEIFASINGPIDKLVSNVVKDLSALGTAKRETLGDQDIVNFDQTRPPAQTLNQLENSLENIVNAASNKLSPSAKQIILAQGTDTPVGNSAPANKAAPDKMRTLTDQVVEALSDLNGTQSSSGTSLDQSVDRLRATLSDLVQEAENQGKGVKSVKHLLEEALGKNQKNLPAALKNKDGSLDISTLIASVVKRSDGKTQTPSADTDYLALIEDEGAKTALTSRIISQKGKGRYLIVKAGDTLSSIAYATYGDAFAYPKIFNANKTLIKNANDLVIGMRLTIPK